MALCRYGLVFGVTLLVVQICLFSCLTDSKFTRKLSTEVLCKNETSSEVGGLVHTTAVGQNDTLHYTFSTHGVPSILVTRTDNEETLSVDCEKFFSHNVNDSKHSLVFKKAHYSYAILFQQLIEYNDTNDVANLEKVPQDNSTGWNFYDLSNVTWMDIGEAGDLDNNEVVFKVSDEFQGLSFRDNGSLSIQLQVFGHEDRATNLPHLEHNANITQLNLILDNINTSFSNARFAVEIAMVSTDHVPDKMALNDDVYIDDEHTPGVFEMIDWTANGPAKERSGYFQFKPVCYTEQKRSLNVGTRATYYALQRPNLTEAAQTTSLVNAYFGDKLYEGKLSFTMTNISFGLSRDKFYTNTYYTVWVASIGFGIPPSDKISTMIIIILSVGLGLPIVLILFGGLGVCVRRRKKKYAAYEEITSDPVIN